MDWLSKHKEKLLIILYCFVISFIILLFTSKCSFLYPFNDWVDANAFFTMGKGMVHGLVPYRDLFEQKGPLLFLIYGIGSLISHTTFFGIFILEVASWTISLYYSYKIITLFLSKKYALGILPIYTAFLCTSRAFVHGGGAEEFCLPFLSITLYYFVLFFKEQNISPKRLIIAGICAGCVLLIKYTLLGFWFGFMACIFFNLFFAKKYQKSFTSCLYFLLGMFIPIGITLIYLGINHAIKDFIDVYFKINITAYNRSASNIFMKLFMLYKGFAASCLRSGPFEVLLVVLFPIFLIPMNIDQKGKINLIIIYCLSILGTFFGLRFYKYYLFPLLIFMLPSLIGIASFLIKYSPPKIKKAKYSTHVLISILLISLLYSYFNANYKEFRKMPKEDLFQYKFAEIINQEKNPTLLEMGYVDCGVYTASGILPNTYYFEKLNISYQNYPNNIDELQKYIVNKNTMFVVYFTKLNLPRLKRAERALFQNYKLIKQEKYNYDNKILNAYLFKVKI